MEAIILAVAPLIVNFVVSYLKMVPTFDSLEGTTRKTTLRGIAMLLSLASMYMSQYVDGSVDLNAIGVASTGVIVFILSQGLYHLYPKKG